jgi:putative nucleotidyltransferase with HDIG domain
LTIVRKADQRGGVAKSATSLDLLVQQDTLDVARQRVAAGKYFYLDAASDWEGFEFLYILSGVVRSADDDVKLTGGDYMYHHGLPKRAHFHVEEDLEFLLVSSPPSFHLMRDEIQEILQLARSVEEKDEETEGHCHRLERLAVATGERLNLAANQLVVLSYAAYLHDVGKVKISSQILNKPGKLSEDEWVEMRKHPDYGAQMIAGKTFLEGVPPIIRAHHERYDGKGYPEGLAADDIPIEARIIAVADAYDAMVSNRPYRRALSKKEAIEELVRNSGSQFDPRVVEAFLGVIGDKQ